MIQALLNGHYLLALVARHVLIRGALTDSLASLLVHTKSRIPKIRALLGLV